LEVGSCLGLGGIKRSGWIVEIGRGLEGWGWVAEEVIEINWEEGCRTLVKIFKAIKEINRKYKRIKIELNLHQWIQTNLQLTFIILINK
jgi:hypothetical protein